MSNVGNLIQRNIMAFISAIILAVIGITLGPTVVSTFADVNATAMADVYMGSVIVLLADFVPFIYYLGVIVAAMATFWAITKTQG